MPYRANLNGTYTYEQKISRFSHKPFPDPFGVDSLVFRASLDLTDLELTRVEIITL